MSAAGEAHAAGYTVAGLDNGIAHTFRVRAVNALGGGPASEPASATPSTPPRVTGVAITSDPGADETYVTGDVIEVTVTFDQVVTLTGTVAIRVSITSLGAFPWAARAVSGSGTRALVFRTEPLRDTFLDTDGIHIPAARMALNSRATLRNAAGGGRGAEPPGGAGRPPVPGQRAAACAEGHGGCDHFGTRGRTRPT